MGLDNVWKDEGGRVMEVLGGDPQKYNRNVEDKLTLKFTLDEWKKLFNVDDGYEPCGTDWVGYKELAPIHIYFVRRVKDERP